VEQAVGEAGGEVTGTAWINQTMRVRVPRNSLATLSELEIVTSLDLPNKLELEGG